MPLLAFIKTPLFKYFAIVLAMFGCGLVIWLNGSSHGAQSVQAKWDADVIIKQKALDKAIADLKIAQAKTNVVVETKYIDRIKTITVKGDTVTQYVDRYITNEDNNACIIPQSFVWLHNTAASSNDTALPPTTSQTDGSPTGIKLTDVTHTITDNYSICHKNAEQLKSLQEWIRRQ